MLGFLSADLDISLRNFLSLIFLLSFTLAWFLILQNYVFEIFDKISGESFWVNLNILLFFGFGAFFAILGSVFSGKVVRRTLLSFWIFLAFLTNILMIFVSGFIVSIIFCVLLGFSLGFGFPSILALLKDHTTVKSRARISGIIFLLALIILFFIFSFISFLDLDIMIIILLLAFLRLFSFFGLLFEEPKKYVSKQDSWVSILSNRGLVFYFLPWLMFNVATGIREWWETPIDFEFRYYMLIGVVFFIILAAIFSFISGLISDYFGRKQPIVLGMILMGVSYAVLGLTLSPLVLLVYDIFSGIAWGLLLTVYLTIPGDLARNFSAEKYYVLVLIIPFMVNGFLTIVPRVYFFRFVPNVLAPFLSIIIFCSIIPILRGGETLPDEVAKERKRKKHFKEMVKLVRKSKSDNS